MSEFEVYLKINCTTQHFVCNRWKIKKIKVQNVNDIFLLYLCLNASNLLFFLAHSSIVSCVCVVKLGNFDSDLMLLLLPEPISLFQFSFRSFRLFILSLPLGVIFCLYFHSYIIFVQLFMPH